MKSHPDAASRMAVEVVTQLPVPSRLGMLRFERLNEPNWALLYLDPHCEQQLGLAAGELCALVGSPYASLMQASARETLHDAIQVQLAHGANYQIRYTLQTVNGPLQLLEMGEPYKQHNRRLLRGFLVVLDEPVAEEARATHSELETRNSLLQDALDLNQQAQQRQLLHLFQRAVEQSANAFLLVNCDGVVEYVNPSFTAITQYNSDEVQGRQLTELPALENLGELIFEGPTTLASSNSWLGEFKSRRKNLEPYWAQLSMSKVYDDQQHLTHYIGVYEDITQSKLSQQRIERLAYTDNLTSLGNRPAFIRNLDERFARDSDSPISLLLVDIDNFKRINDSLGHQTGDKLLISLARRLRNSLSSSGSLARFASNEFAVLLDETDLEIGQQVASQLLATLDKPMFVDNQLISVTGSVGLACAPLHGRDPQTLMRNAGLALHKAKANGKHQVQVFTEALNAEASYKLFVENNLRRALTQNELDVFYQPKLCLRSGRLLGMEALLRWNHPEKGMIRPDQFISVAEETGLIIPIGKWIARQACRMSRQLSAAGLGNLQVAINLSPKQFSDPDLVASIATILKEEQLPANLLELELTEGLLLEATEDTRLQLDQLKSFGLTLAMDDFGTGYSSLSYLKKFPIDIIKIDRSFIHEIPDNQDDMEITSAVIAMAHNLKLKVVAEGIETAEQLAFLRRHRCDVGQGYLFDRPIPGAELPAMLKRYPRGPIA
jgi:diguanylate cyclase (GGDEF)-like protein/PAS domain S-box-containing protein